MTIGSDADLAGMRRAGAVVAEALRDMETATRPGITTAELDAVAADVLRRHGARPAPHDSYGFPGTACISVNDEIVHGIPGARTLRPRDVVKLDVTVALDGYVADAAVTVLVPPSQPEGRRLRRCVRRAFDAALAVVRPGAPLRAIGRAVEAEAARWGCSVVRELQGHGVGRKIHEAPEVFNYDTPLAHGTLHEGLVFALEPIVSLRPTRALDDADGWTVRTRNGSLAAHHEHTVLVTRTGAEILTRVA
jgi:methionyl aminopeptidase